MKLAIFNTEQHYHSDLESFCDANCILQVLDHYGVRNSVLYLDSSLNIHLFKDEKKKLGYNVEFNYNFVKDAYLNKIHKYTPAPKDSMEIWEQNKARLREGVPIIAGIDLFHLDYTNNFNTYHCNHKAILCGYSKDDKYATVIDCYDWYYKGDVLLEQFLKARASICPNDGSPYSGYPIENQWIEVDDSNWSIDMNRSLKETIDASLYQYYEKGTSKYNSDYYGVAALYRIHELFLEHKSLGTDEKLELIANIRVIFLFLYTRLKLFRHYMEEASNNIKLGLLKNLLISLSEDIEEWRKVSMLMLKGTVSITENSYTKISNKIRELIDLEEKRYQQLSLISSIL